ncbi:hypothetical protein QTI66_29010 [Variovorax sp. J22R133]|uniref:hypothetical protein n=1 Tax=Variovorax brevis TaxID=3053503 RepID=UPI002576F508|nr:hypothetical protein [Variovorax sp. J22R133]MDM0116211.1 hypothetical protein [Variovorax sp. J22R133]
METRRAVGQRGASQTDFFLSVRFDPRTKFQMNIAAKLQGRSDASFMKWAVDRSFGSILNAVFTANGRAVTFAEADSGPSELWHHCETDRFLNVASRLPEVLTSGEKVLFQKIKEVLALSNPSRGFVDDIWDRQLVRANRTLIYAGIEQGFSALEMAQALCGNKRLRAAILKFAKVSDGPFKSGEAAQHQSERKKGSKGDARSHYIAVRIPPRAKFRLEIVSRMRRISISSYIEWAIESALASPETAMTTQDGRTITFAEANGGETELWHRDAVQCLLNVGMRLPEILEDDERKLMQTIKESFSAMTPPRPFRGDARDRADLAKIEDLIYIACDHDVAPGDIARALNGDTALRKEIEALAKPVRKIIRSRGSEPLD